MFKLLKRLFCEHPMVGANRYLTFVGDYGEEEIEIWEIVTCLDCGKEWREDIFEHPKSET